jgi:hypothetical protein
MAAAASSSRAAVEASIEAARRASASARKLSDGREGAMRERGAREEK